jgi:hypothetical protein
MDKNKIDVHIGLGSFKDSIKNLLSACEYLKNSNTDKSIS